MPTSEELKVLNKMKRTSQGAYARSKNKAPKVKGQALPGGITGGIARFSDYKLGLDKNGNPYIQLIGIVITPEEFSGCRCQIGHFLAASKTKSLAEKYDGLFSDLQILGINTNDMKNETVLEDCIEELKKLTEEKRPFQFNTWKPANADQAFIFLQKTVDPDTLPDEAAVTWEEPTEESDDQEEAPEEPEEAEEVEEPAEEETAEGDAEDSGDDEGDLPDVGFIYAYRTNAKATPMEVEVTGVDYDEETVDLKRVKDGKEFAKVPFSKLESAE